MRTIQSSVSSIAHENIDAKIVLIDGNQLAEYMIEHNIGVSDVKKYIIKSINSDYFDFGEFLSQHD